MSIDPEMHEKHIGVRIFLLLTLVALGLMYVAATCHLLFFKIHRDDFEMELVAMVMCSPLLGFSLWAAIKAFHPPRQLSYVGRNGIALLTPDKSGNRIVKSSIVCFDKMHDLYVEVSDLRVRGIYVHTMCFYRWEGPTPFTLKYGFYKKPPPHHPYSFALAAEAAWSAYAWQRSLAEFTRTKFMTFSVNDRDCVRVGPEILYFEVGNRHEQLRLDEIARASLWQGIVCFRHKDARWFTRAGKFEFPYGKIANAHVFVMALNKLLGVTLDETGRVEVSDSVV